MPSIPPSSNVLVTGGTGYIGAWVIKILLERGLSVRAVVRSEGKAGILKRVFSEETEAGRLTFFLSDDPFKHGALDDAVKGVEGVVHLASPLGAQGSDDPDDFIKPAINGTLGVLRSALAHGAESLKRIVITSSCAAVYTGANGPGEGAWGEECWNDAALEQLKVEGRNAHDMVKYRASKVLAERAAWEFYNEHKESVGWDMVVLNPPVVFGPPLLPDILSPSAAGESMKVFYDLIIADTPKPMEVIHGSHGWADVRDIAEAHVLALEKRKLEVRGSYSMQVLLSGKSSLAPSVWPGRQGTYKGIPLLEDEKVYKIRYKTEKQEKFFGLKYRTKEETTRDIMEDYTRRGW